MLASNWYEYIPRTSVGRDVAERMTYALQQLYIGNIIAPDEIRYFAQTIRLYGECHVMAKRASNHQQQGNPPAGKLHWVTIDLTAEDKATLAQLNWTADEILDNMAELVRDGYSVSTKFDGYSGSVACHITNNTRDHRDFGYGVTGYGAVLTDAVCVALYKLDHCARGCLATYKAVPDRFR